MNYNWSPFREPSPLWVLWWLHSFICTSCGSACSVCTYLMASVKQIDFWGWSHQRHDYTYDPNTFSAPLNEPVACKRFIPRHYESCVESGIRSFVNMYYFTFLQLEYKFGSLEPHFDEQSAGNRAPKYYKTVSDRNRFILMCFKTGSQTYRWVNLLNLAVFVIFWQESYTTT